MSSQSRLSSRPQTLQIDTRHRASEVRATVTVIVRMDHSVEVCGLIDDVVIAVDILEAGKQKVVQWHAAKGAQGLVDAQGRRVGTA